MALILLTRPQAQSEALAEALGARGWTPLIEPMLTFETLPPPPDFAAMMGNTAALAFTSANGVRAFATADGRRDLPVYAVGDATADAARATGFEAVRSAAGDADALAALILGDPPEGPLVHVRGAHGRGDLAARLREAGLKAQEIALYAMRAAHALPAETADAFSQGRVRAAAFYSPRTAGIFAELALSLGLSPLADVRAIAISAAAAEPLNPLGFKRVDISERPDAAAMLEAIGTPDSADA